MIGLIAKMYIEASVVEMIDDGIVSYIRVYVEMIDDALYYNIYTYTVELISEQSTGASCLICDWAIMLVTLPILHYIDKT